MSDWTHRLVAAGLIPLAIVNAYWILGLLVFSLRSAARGVPRSARFDKLGRSRVIPRFILEYGYWQLRMQLKVFQKLGFSPDGITLLSLVLAIAGAVLIGSGSFGLGGWMMFLSFFCDAFDGLLARELGLSSPRGEFIDSVVDRYADVITGLGFMYYYRNDALGAAACGFYLIGSTVMGYAKAKGEVMGVDPNVGVMQRHERAVYLGVSTVVAPFASLLIEPDATHPRFHLALAALVLVAFFTNVTSIWRIAYVLRRLPRPTPQAPVVEEGAAAVAVEPDAAPPSGHANGQTKPVATTVRP
jgi:phosphatidylglycerophosphate synthase